MTDETKEIKSEWVDRPDHKMIGKLPIRFVPNVNKYATPEKTHTFSVHLNLDSSTTSAK